MILPDERLLLLVERIERLLEEISGLRDDVKDVYAEAKAVGYDVKLIRTTITRRAMTPDSRREADALLIVYEAALGAEHAGGEEYRDALLVLTEVKAAQVTEARLAELAGLVALLDPAAEATLVAIIAGVLDLRARKREVGAEITASLKLAKAEGFDPPRISEVCRRVELIEKHGQPAVLAAEATRFAYADAFERRDSDVIGNATKDAALAALLTKPAPAPRKINKTVERLRATADAARRALRDDS